MINPFVDNLQDLTVTELEVKLLDLQGKYFKTSNPQLQSQIASIIEIYREEIRARRAAEYISQQNGDSDLDNLINVS